MSANIPCTIPKCKHTWCQYASQDDKVQHALVRMRLPPKLGLPCAFVLLRLATLWILQLLVLPEHQLAGSVLLLRVSVHGHECCADLALALRQDKQQRLGPLCHSGRMRCSLRESGIKKNVHSKLQAFMACKT